MSSKALRFVIVVGLLTVAVLASGCADDAGGGGGSGGGESKARGEGEPCTVDDECAEGLTCDVAHAEPTCEPPHSGVSASAGSTSTATGAGGGEPASPCERWCACLASTCSDFAGYPYAEAGSCDSSCGDITDEELSCWGSFCEQAEQAVAGIDHLCEHAWGSTGLEECE